MATLNRLERDHAGPDCYRFLNIVGVGRKNIDEVTCNRCHNKVIKTTAKGIADYHAVVNGMGLVVEAKAGSERFPFSEWRLNQRAWMRRWEVRSGGIGWIWLALGDERVNARNFPRTTFLMPRNVFTDFRRLIRFEGNSKSIALNELAAQHRVLERSNGLWATNLMKDWQLDWTGDDIWMPPVEHFFWKVYFRTQEAQNVRNSIISSRNSDKARST